MQYCKLVRLSLPATFALAYQWKRIGCKQSTGWQHLSWLKASAIYFLQKHFLIVEKHSNLYLGLVHHLVGDRAQLCLCKDTQSGTAQEGYQASNIVVKRFIGKALGQAFSKHFGKNIPSKLHSGLGA
jgi:hypothetical protein